MIRFEDVETESLREFLTDTHAAKAVPFLVERWREDTDSTDTRQYGDDATADTALGGQTGAKCPLTRKIVHSA